MTADALLKARELVDGLGHRNPTALRELAELGEAALPAIVEGLKHGNWRVRRSCAVFLDHHGKPELLPALIPLLNDPKSDVRFWAAHTLGCDQCKEACLPIDPVPYLIQRIQQDESIRVRRQALTTLVWTRPVDRRILEVCESILQSENDRRMRLHASSGVLKAVELSPSATSLSQAIQILKAHRERREQR